MGKKITVYQASDWDYRKLVSYRRNGGEAFSVSCFGFDKLSLTNALIGFFAHLSAQEVYIRSSGTSSAMNSIIFSFNFV